MTWAPGLMDRVEDERQISAENQSRFADRRRLPATQSPRHPDFVAVVLEPLARRWRFGESEDDLRVELYTSIHPWALSFAGALSAGLPPHADRNEVLSQVLQLTWDACRRLDWDRYAAWPAYLETKVKRARIEAARSDDWLSRRERVRRRTFQGELARREQVEQRSLSDSERQAVASEVAPSSSRVDWTSTLLNSRYPSTVADVPDTIDDVTLEDQVERRELGGIRVRCLTEWLTMLATQNEALAEELSRWAALNESGDRPLPARLAHRLEQYTPVLLAMLGEAA
ncbi:MAG: hypothetical protein QOE00_2246 [Ilumatobacteraceae bacterium]